MILNPQHFIWLIFATLMGACIGSFLNVVIYRVPRRMKVSEPKRSFCPGCQADIPWWCNIPIISWLALRGKCRGCKGPIAVHYVLVEALTAILFLLAWISFPPAEAVLLWVAISLWVPILWIDAEHMIIPIELTWTGSAIAILGAIFAPGVIGLSAGIDPVWWERALRSILGWVAGFAGLGAIVLLGKMLFGKQNLTFESPVPFLLREPEDDDQELQFVVDGEPSDWGDLFFRKSDRLILDATTVTIDEQSWENAAVVIAGESITVNETEFLIENIQKAEGSTTSVVIPREAMGSGDPHLLAMIGALLGYQSLLLVVMGSCVTAIGAAICARVGLGKALPYGPFLIAGAAIWLCGGWKLWSWYFEWTKTVGL